MSLVPMLFRDWWDDHDISRPSQLHDQHFGTGLNLDDLLSSMSLQRNKYFRPWKSSCPLMRQDSGSTVCNDRDKFQVILDVQQFAPREVVVKVCGLSVVVEGKHEEKQDEHGFISRHFVRRYLLPAGHEPEDVVSTLSSDGILTVTAPKRAERTPKGERVVPITPTGPAKATVAHADSPQPIIEHPN